MEFARPLTPAVLLRRYQRFLADMRLDSGETVVAHCPNTGSMLGVNRPGSRAWLSPADNPARKLAWTWELAEGPRGGWVGIHTGRANALVREALEAGLIAELAGFTGLRMEARLSARSRTDLLLDFPGGPCYVEVKNLTAAADGGQGFFPDAVSERAHKHLDELSAVVAAGGRAAVVFCVQREDVEEVAPADHIDPEFGRRLRAAARQGVELFALGARLSPRGITLARRLPVRLAPRPQPM
ncbi:MAG: DNA/RNA nuclease SfsA [Pseudomonadota bacterium]